MLTSTVTNVVIMNLSKFMVAFYLSANGDFSVTLCSVIRYDSNNLQPANIVRAAVPLRLVRQRLHTTATWFRIHSRFWCWLFVKEVFFALICKLFFHGLNSLLLHERLHYI